MKIRGSVLLSRKAFVEEHFGKGAWSRVLDHLSEDDRTFLKKTMVHVGWYPFEIGQRLDQAIVDVLGKGNLSVFEQIGAESAKKNLTQNQNAFLTPGEPQKFMAQAKMIYDFYYDTGYREYKKTGPNSGVMTTHGAETFSAVDCLTVIGWYKEALKLCGAKNVRMTEESCRAKGGSCCRYVVSWE